MKYALLIDSENTQASMDDVFQELSKYGDTPIRYLIGDFTTNKSKAWVDVCRKHAITCVQTINFSNRKNSLDISLVIEGMKLLYEKSFLDGVVIVATDSDYTPLAREWRNAGKDVIGIGRKNSTESYRASCTTFIYEENICDNIPTVNTSAAVLDKANNESITSIDKIKELMDSILDDNNGKQLVSIIVSAIRKVYSDFDVRNYKYQKAIDFFKSEFNHVELVKEDARTYSLQYKAVDSVNHEALEAKPSVVEAKEEPKKKPAKKQTKKKQPTKTTGAKLDAEMKKTIIDIFKSLKKKEVKVNDLAQALTNKQIKCKALGFKKFTDMISSISDFEIINDNVSLKKKTVKVTVTEIDDEEL